MEHGVIASPRRNERILCEAGDQTREHTHNKEPQTKGTQMKYKLTEQTRDYYDITLYRIEATSSFGDVKEGDLGGWIEKEDNLSQRGEAWIADEAIVYNNARICCNALVSGNDLLYGKAMLSGRAMFTNMASLFGKAYFCGDD
jgi:hypothetical protein